MRRALLLLCVLVRAALGAQAVQRSSDARKVRSAAPPQRTGYLYRRVNDEPAVVETFTSALPDAKDEENAATNVSEASKSKEKLSVSSTENTNKTTNEGMPTMADSRDAVGAAGRNPWPGVGTLTGYDAIFRTDDDEHLRTDFKNSYDIWPFFYQNLYEYEPKKLDTDVEKAKDKRFAISSHKVIPVHENVDEGVSNEDPEKNINSKQNFIQTNVASTDNPIFGNQPFFSYVLNDYFDKNDEDDSTKYKGLSWEKDFDHEMALQDVEDYAKRIRRLEETPKVNGEEKINTLIEHDLSRQTIKSKGRDLNHNSLSKVKGDDNKHSSDGRHEYDAENYRGFKDFADSFAHRFGAEDHDREAKYAKKNNADKGEKKKGFRTIYHKDEYQEHHDFFDNTDDSENAEEKGASKVHIGGSEAFLHSLAGAALGSDQNKLGHIENIEKKLFEKNQDEKHKYIGTENELNHYKDVAKHTALSNNADYVDRYMI